MHDERNRDVIGEAGRYFYRSSESGTRGIARGLRGTAILLPSDRLEKFLQPSSVPDNRGFSNGMSSNQSSQLNARKFRLDDRPEVSLRLWKWQCFAERTACFILIIQRGCDKFLFRWAKTVKMK